MALITRFLTLADGSPPIPIGTYDTVAGAYTPNVQPTADSNGAAFQGAAVITPGGAAVTAARSLGYVCTASGTMTVTFADGTTLAIAITTGGGFQTLPFAITGLVLSAGAAGSFWNLK